MGRIVPSMPGIRILQSIKGGSYTVTIPRWWVDKHGLKKGSKLFMAEDGVSLRIAARESIQMKKTVEIDLDSLKDMKSARYCILTYYMQGADEMIVKSRDVLSADRKKQLREMRLALPGVEIIHDDAHRIVYRVFTEEMNEKLDDTIMMIHNMALTTHRDAVRSVVSGNAGLANDVVSREAELLRVYRKLIRHLSLCSTNPEIAFKSGVGDSRELVTYALVARDLNRTVYHAIYIAKHYLRLAKPLSAGKMLKMIEALSETASKMQQLAVEAFIDKNFQKVLDVTAMMQDVKQHEERINFSVVDSVKNLEQAITLLMIAREIRRIAGYSVAMADAAANRILAPGRAAL